MRTIFTTTLVLAVLTAPVWPQTPGATGNTPDSGFTEHFRQADTNGDGVITPDEARAAGLWFTDDFQSVDTDRSGTVNLFELGQALQQRLSRWMADLDAADTNHDGRVTEAEAQRVPSVAAAFTALKRAQDDAVNRQQFESYAIDRVYRNSELPSVAPNIIDKRF